MRIYFSFDQFNATFDGEDVYDKPPHSNISIILFWKHFIFSEKYKIIKNKWNKKSFSKASIIL